MTLQLDASISTTRSRHAGLGLWLALAIAVCILCYGFWAEELYLVLPWGVDARLRMAAYVAIGCCVIGLVYVFARQWCLQLALAGLLLLALVVSSFAALGILLLYAVSAVAIGSAVMARAEAPRALDVAIAFGIGTAILVIAYNFLVRLPVNYAAFHILLLILPVAFYRQRLRPIFHTILAGLRQPSHLPLFDYLVGAFIVALMAMYLIIAALPEIYNDPLAVYLYMASRLKSAAIWDVSPTYMISSTMPLGLVWIQAVLAMIGGEVAAKLSNVGQLAATAAMVFFATRAEAGRLGALALVGLLVSAPPFFLQTVSLFYDNGIALLVTCAFLLAFHPDRPRPDRRAIFLAAIVLGAAAASKMTILVMAPFFWAVFTVDALRKGGLKELRWPFFAGVVFLLAACFPYIWAYFSTGNPIFPLKNNIFHSPLIPPHDFTTIYSNPLRWDLLYRITFDTEKFLEGGKGSFGFFVLFLLPIQLAALLLLRSPLLRIGVFIALGAGLALSLQQQYVRYYTPLFPMLLIAASPILAFSGRLDRRAFRVALMGCLAVIALLNAYFMPTSAWPWRSFPIDKIWTEASRRAWVTYYVPQRVLIDRIEASHGADARVLLVDPVVAAGLTGIPLMYNWYNLKLFGELSAAKDEADIERVLARYQTTHLLLPSQPRTMPFKIDLLQGYARSNLRLVESLGGIDLWLAR